MNRTLLAVPVLISSLLFTACADSSMPAPPALGVQIDRMGRAGVNTALTAPFDLDATSKGQVQDDYNAAAQPRWSSFAPRIATNLAILDSLDTVCGNQLLAGPSAGPGRYDALAGVLADDQLYVNTNSGTCQLYLAVEANAVGIANNDCGGRTPLYNTIDETYSLLAAGALSGVTNGITFDADAQASLTNFPFFAPPNR
jgi:hypothetical protein